MYSTNTAAVTTRHESPARQRMLSTARALFYSDGVRAVGIDRIIAEAGVAKATFYHHFATKDDLVCAYLEERSMTERALAERLRLDAMPPMAKILALFDVISEVGCKPDFRGCAFINAAAEYPDPAHPVRQVIAAHRRWFRAILRDLLTAAGHPDAEDTAALLTVVRDGLVVGSDLGDPAEVSGLTRAAVQRILGGGRAEPA
jgi:AcrR family transcriptional regulator